MQTIDSLNRAGAASAAARIAKLEAEVARLRALVAHGAAMARDRYEYEGGCWECARGYDLLGNTACGRRIVAVRDHVPSCQVGRFMREAGEVAHV